MRQRLIELLQTVPTDPEGNRNVGVIADYLLENGVVVWNNELKCGEVIELKSESEALNRIALQLEVLNRMKSDFNYYEHCLKIAKKSIEEQQPEIKKDNGWISVKDRLPGRSGYYLCCHLQEVMAVIYYNAKNKLFNVFDRSTLNYLIEITHWMPLPELPEGE